MERFDKDLSPIFAELENSHFDEINNNFTICLERIGRIIKNLRKDKGISQKDLANLTNITQANLSRIECGKYNMSIKQLCKIMDALDANWEIEVDCYDRRF